MFPFILKGKIPLGLRREYHLSETGLEERITERLVTNARRSKVRTDGSFSGDGRGLIAGGLSRLRSMGFLTAVRVRKIRIISKNDFLFAGYEMDATALTLVCMVIIPLVLGSILFSLSAFSFCESLAILLLLVLITWGLDVLPLVMMLRHEIYQIASEIRTIMRKRDALQIDLHHRDLSPEELLATAYYYERNGLVRKCEAYLTHLAARHPDTFEATLAHEHMESLEGTPTRLSSARTREGERKGPDPSDYMRSGSGNRKLFLKASLDSGNGSGRDARGEHRGWSRMTAPFRKRKDFQGRPENMVRGTERRKKPDARSKGKSLFRIGKREALSERVVRKRRERLERREALASAPDEKNLPRGVRMRVRLARFFRWEGREERRYRRKQERWLHGPRAPKPTASAKRKTVDRRYRRPNWMRSREEKEAVRRQKRWTEGSSGLGKDQKSRDKWGKWLLRRKSREERLMSVRRSRAVEEGPYA